jgi:hypothetical protein
MEPTTQGNFLCKRAAYFACGSTSPCPSAGGSDWASLLLQTFREGGQESFLAQIRQVALDPGGWHPGMPTIICCIRERSALVHICGEFDVNARASAFVGKDPLLDCDAVAEDATVARQLPPILRYQVEHFIGPTIECIAGLVINDIDLVVVPHLGDHLGISAHLAYGDIMKGTLPPHGAASGRVARPPRA